MPLLMLLVFALTLFVSATLLFLVQPMVGKLILPFLGGTPAVWNTCMVFFQALLLVGYSYAHFVSRKLSIKAQLLLHTLVLALPLAPLIWLRFDVVRVADHWPPPANTNPAWWLLAVLFLVAGLPFFVVSTSAPLLQKWFADTDHPSARDPYFLYGASNIGSMLALLAYPWFVERKFGVHVQTLYWAAGFCGLAFLILICGLLANRPTARRVEAKADEEAPGFLRKLRWVALAFVPSSLMLGLTTHITTDIAAIPLLWILPLALYLLSFIFVFAGTFLQNLYNWLALTAACAYIGWELWAKLMGLAQLDGPPPAELSAQLKIILAVTGQTASQLKVALGLCALLPWLGLLVFLNRSQAFLHGIWVAMLPILILGVAFDWDLRKADYLKEYQTILMHFAALFVAAMVCHGELARTRPAPTHLTGFYLLMSLGGVLGGMFNALVAPVVFDRIVEYPLVIALACVLMPRFGATERGFHRQLDFSFAAVVLAFGLVMSAFFVGNAYLSKNQVAQYVDKIGTSGARAAEDEEVASWLEDVKHWIKKHIGHDDSELMLRERNFFGCFLLRNYTYKGGSEEYHLMLHGTTTHGMQCYYPEERRSEPLTYFHKKGPIGQLFEAVQAKERRQRVCVLGLGTGTLAAYMQPGWDLTLYEIDPAVYRVATDTRYFTYLADAERRGVNVQVDLGDGRLQIARAPDQSYDLIFMDAFTSDAVPVHLLTKEAFQVYLRKLAPGGLIVVNIANRYLSFESVLGNLAEDLGIRGRRCWGREDKAIDMYATNWVVLARDEASFGKLLDFPGQGEYMRWQSLPTDPALGVWTDDYSNLLAVFKWGR